MRWVFLLPVIPSLLMAQTPDVGSYIERVRAGDVNDVRDQIPDLLDRFPSDPGVRYLEGLVTEDGADAVRVFQGIVDEFPESEWADDALYRVYQFYYAIGLYRTAELKWEQLADNYPQSDYLSRKPAIESVGPVDELPPSGADIAAEQDSGIGPGSPGAGAGQVGQFALQVGAYSSRENAEKQKLFFEDQNYPVEVINRVKESRSFFLVLVGNYLTYEEAKVKGAEIRRTYNIDSFVVSR